MKEVYAYGSDGGNMIPSPQPIQNNTNNIEIQNIGVQPSTIKVGDTFTVTATLVNNSPNPIFVDHGACEAPFSVTFDNYVLVSENNINCTTQMILQKLDVGTKITATSPYLDLVYHAIDVGNTNATITFRYGMWDLATQGNIEKTISKSFQFMIYDHNTGIPSLNYVEHPVMILIDSPLKQVQSGIAANDVKCNAGFQLIFKAEDYTTPACVQPETATKLIQRGWALDTTSPVPFIKKMEIEGLQQTYTVGQPINATVKYTGYSWYREPDVKILDANGTQIWFNCAYCYTRSEAIQSPSLGTFIYHVREYSSNNPPVINKTGTYTMVATLDNKTAEAKFDIIPASLQQTIPNPIYNSTSSNGPEFKVGPDLLGPLPHQLVFFMKSNSTAKIFVEYTSNEPNTGTLPSYSSVYVGKGGNFTPLMTSDVTIIADPSSIPKNKGSDTRVVYTVTAKEGVKGVYWIFLVQFCRVMPLAIDINSLTISPFDIPVQTGIMHCPAQFLEGKILGISGGTAEYKIGQPVQ